ncbi:CDGSH iron-sulfur domain-containing protein [Actinophytocola oryzae]|uniref:Iron-binding CDGSH zinc finger protein n=1 Tax=Actinophytocola oryzae TaxID=502181 RepID=A0A4R7VQE1_9PSEU|nr:CDGSH iron-sulfur domain-containing protein [Actinophytocola oryzae]TDV51884.1 iron-binding CDGSH zinc finger protein [Actinophytocola oryzae]
MSRADAPVVITEYRNGPLLVRGNFRILDADGEEIPTTRRTVALCRCGRSAQKPWCDSSHKIKRQPRGTFTD